MKNQGSKRKERAQSEDEEGEHSEKKKRKGGKKKKRDKSEKSHYETEEVEADRVEYQEDMDEPHNGYEDPNNQFNAVYDDGEDNAQDPLAAVGLEDSDAEVETVITKCHICAISLVGFIFLYQSLQFITYFFEKRGEGEGMII